MLKRYLAIFIAYSAINTTYAITTDKNYANFDNNAKEIVCTSGNDASLKVALPLSKRTSTQRGQIADEAWKITKTDSTNSWTLEIVKDGELKTFKGLTCEACDKDICKDIN